MKFEVHQNGSYLYSTYDVQLPSEVKRKLRIAGQMTVVATVALVYVAALFKGIDYVHPTHKK